MIRPEAKSSDWNGWAGSGASIYKTLVLTGLRKGELASLTVGQMYLDGPHPFADLAAADEKNRQGSAIPLRIDLADRYSPVARRAGNRIAASRQRYADDSVSIQQSSRPTATTRLQMCRSCRPLRRYSLVDYRFSPCRPGLVRILGLRLEAVARQRIDKRDERGRTLVTFHALRTSFGTLLSISAASHREHAQAAMRHSTIDFDDEYLHRSEAVGRCKGRSNLRRRRCR